MRKVDHCFNQYFGYLSEVRKMIRVNLYEKGKNSDIELLYNP